jgi:DNA-binding transcriptional LysR family regulator
VTVDLDTRLLRAFVVVAEELNFTRAAQRLFLAQQALSSQVAQLEARLGVKLFERTTRRVTLTAAGERFLEPARSALAALDAGTAELARTATLRVGMSATAGVPLVGEAIRRFRAELPEVELVLSSMSLNQPAAGLREGPGDVAFVARREWVRPEDVVNEPWIWVEGADPRARAFWSLEDFRGGKPLRTGTRITSVEEAFGAVAAGVAITCQGESAVRAVGAGFPQLRFVPLRGAPPAQVAVAWRTAADSELVRALVRIAISTAPGGE